MMAGFSASQKNLKTSSISSGRLVRVSRIVEHGSFPIVSAKLQFKKAILAAMVADVYNILEDSGEEREIR